MGRKVVVVLNLSGGEGPMQAQPVVHEGGGEGVPVGAGIGYVVRV